MIVKRDDMPIGAQDILFKYICKTFTGFIRWLHLNRLLPEALV